MQKTEIHWSPNDRNQLAEIGAEIIIHSFDRPLSGESGKCLSGGTNKKTTRLNYPLDEKNNIKCCAWWPSEVYPYVFAIGQPNGKIFFRNVKDRADPFSQGRTEIEVKQGRACVALTWNQKHPNLLLSGFDRVRSENSLAIWDIHQNGSGSSSSSSQMTGTNENYNKRIDMTYHEQQTWRPFFDYGLNEQCHSLTWFKPNEKLFAAAVSQNTSRSIKIYDPRGSPPQVISFPTKSLFNLCADFNEIYLAASSEKTVFIYDTRAYDKPLITREEHEPIVKLSWSRNGSSQLGYCIRESPKFHLLSVTSTNPNHENEIFVHRILQCPIQQYRMFLSSFDWNYFDENRLVLLGGKEYFDYVIPSRSTIDYSPRNGLLWTNGQIIHPAILHQDQTQITSKVLFTYDLSNISNERRSLTPTSSISNTEFIQMDLKTISKETQTTIEQIQRWIKNTNINRDPYPFIGVIEALREAQPSSTSTTVHQSWSSIAHPSQTKTVYESTERQIVSQLCGWSNIDMKSGSYDRMNCLLEQDEYEKVAAIYIFQMNAIRALEVLNQGLQQGGKEELATLILALVGSIRATSTNNDEKTINDFSSVTKLFHRPYVRAMFAFILTPDGNDLQYECVLDEQLDLSDKVAFAVKYLNDQRLFEKLDKLADESRDKGDLQGILLTGLRQNGCELIQKYLDQTSDIRTSALLAIYVPEDVHQECPYVQEWIEGFRLLLDELQLWNERAEFDIYRSHVTGTTPHRRQFYDRSISSTQHFSCIFCQTPLEGHQGGSNQTPTNNFLTGNTNSTPMPTTPIRGHTRGSQQMITNRSSASSSSTYPPPNSDMLMVCAKCRQVLPRCSICMMSLTTYIEDASYIYEPIPDKHTLMSSQWFTWCRLCRHGGHAEHVSNWFAMNQQCPIAKCLCRCTLIDGIFC